jgi:D-xylose transport system permease protein
MTAPMEARSLRDADERRRVMTAPIKARSLGDYVGDYWRRVRGGEMGSLPALGAIVALIIGFAATTDSFLTPYNFDLVIHQGAQVAIIAMGLIFVLLVGEIDLSAGFTSGLCAALMTALMTERGVAWYYAVRSPSRSGRSSASPWAH